MVLHHPAMKSKLLDRALGRAALRFAPLLLVAVLAAVATGLAGRFLASRRIP
jgi:hypothetical protein